MKTYQERLAVEEKLFQYALNKSGDERFKYAMSFGLVWAMLTDEQIETLDRYLTEWSK